MIQIRMKEGAPPDSELLVRVTSFRSYRPDPKDYIDKSDTFYKDEGGGKLTDGTKLGMMLYDKANIDANEFAIEEIFGGSADDIHVWELVDEDGNVWTEEYDDGQPDPDELNVDHRCPTCESHSPNLHPAVQGDGGEVQPCPDKWHKR